MKTTKLLALAAISSAWAVSAQAAIDLQLGTFENDGFQIGSTLNDNLNPLQVNLEASGSQVFDSNGAPSYLTSSVGMFGIDEWVFAQKDNDLDGTDETVIDIGLTITGDTLSGTWSIDANTWSTYSSVMFVLKDGGGNVDPDTYVGYLLQTGDTSGTYSSIFENLGNGKAKDISHISAYVLVPEPSTYAFLLGAASLAGVIGYRRSRAKKS